MKRTMLGLLLLAGVAVADRMPDPPLPERIGRAELTVLGKITRIEEKAVDLPATPGEKEKSSYKVAVIEVKETIAGKTSSKVVKLAFPAAAGVGRGFPLLNFKAGDERIFSLMRLHGTEYYRTAFPWDVTPAEGEVLVQARRAGKLLADPMKGLKSKDAAERSLAAGLLVTRYRTRPIADPKEVKEEAIPAPESQLILEALASAEWSVPEFTRFTPRSQFLALGLTEKDGWKLNFATLEADAKKWLKANAGKYRIKRFTTGITAEP
jgi:hypothetical protein